MAFEMIKWNFLKKPDANVLIKTIPSPNSLMMYGLIRTQKGRRA